MQDRTLRRRYVVGVAIAVVVGIGGCNASTGRSAHHGSPRDPAPDVTLASPGIPGQPHVGHSTRRPALPAVQRVTRHSLGASWHPGCPVPPSQLRAVRVRFVGFDRRRHVGVIVVNAHVVRPVRKAFRSLRRARFPIRHVIPITAYGGSDNASMRHDNTSAFNCRYAVADGPKTWSEHAYGEAIDLDPRENPYRLDGKILPPSGASYADRSRTRRGMILASSAPVIVFDRLGWGWGGRWSSTPDYQHFSLTGR